MTNLFTEEYNPTIEDCYYKSLEVDGTIIHIEVIDTAGQEEFHSMLDQWIRGADGVLLLYDVSNRATFLELERFYEKMMQVDAGVPFMLVGNKCDVPDSIRKVYTSEGKHLAETQFQCPFMEVSAKERINDTAVFHDLIRIIRARTAPPTPINKAVCLGTCCTFM
jgi:small GTP-binding protein